MKKVKTDKSTVPISLTAKKQASLNHETLFTPYKIQWKNSTPASQQPSSRTFFNTMKTDLATLKSDVERMIKKQVFKREVEPAERGISEPNTNVKKEIDQKQDKKEEYHSTQGKVGKINDLEQVLQESITEKQNGSYGKIEIESLFTEAISKQGKFERLEKQNEELQKIILQINCQLDRQIETKKTYEKQFNGLLQQFKKDKKEQERRWQKEKEKIQAKKNGEIQQKIEQLNRVKKALQQKTQESEKEKSILEEKLRQIQQYSNELVGKNSQLLKKIQNSPSEGEIQDIRKMNTDLRNHNHFLEEKIENLSSKMNLVGVKFREKEIYIQELQQSVERYAEKYKNTTQDKQEAERRSRKLFKTIQEERDRLSISIQQSKQRVEFLEDQNSQKQRQIHKMKLSSANFLQKQKLLVQEIEQLKELNKKLKLENEQLRRQRQTSIHHQSGLQFSFRDETSIELSKLGKQYQRQINELIEENYRLKNQLTFQQSEKQRMEICTKRLKEQILLYEEIKVQYAANRFQNESEWEKLIQQISTLKKEKDSIVQQFQYKILKLQNQLQQQKVHKRSLDPENCIPVGNFNKLIRDQLQQNEELREKLKEASKQIQQLQVQLQNYKHKEQILKEELNLERMKSQFDSSKCNNSEEIRKSIGELRKKYEGWDEKIEYKNRVIKAKDQFIERVLVLKAQNKQEEICTLLKEIRSSEK